MLNVHIDTTRKSCFRMWCLIAVQNSFNLKILHSYKNCIDFKALHEGDSTKILRSVFVTNKRSREDMF